MTSPSLFNINENEWNDAGHATLRDFIFLVANTPLKIQIIATFLSDPYLCLSSEALAHRLSENQSDVQRSARELCTSGAFQYCASFGYSDLCGLSFARCTPAVQHCLCLLRLALRLEPEFVWSQVATGGFLPSNLPTGS